MNISGFSVGTNTGDIIKCCSVNRDMSEMSREMDLTRKWPYAIIVQYHTIQGQHEIHYHKTMATTTILAWECGCCEKMNEA
jgi:hypothetical protein